MPGNPYYLETVDKKGIKFGDNDLVIESDFKNVQSYVTGKYFSFGSYLISNKISSVFPDQKKFEPD